MPLKFKQFQFTIFIISLIAVFLTIFKLIINPETSRRKLSQYQFPEQLSLPEWQFIKSINSPLKVDYEQVIANQKYIYKKDEQELEIVNRYVVGTRGMYHGMIKLEENVNDNNEVNFLLSTRQKNSLNYALFTKENKAYLVSCINPRGGSTITTTQFMANRYKYDLKLQRLFPWLIGKESSIDLRCLWSSLSISINDNNSPEIAYQTLEQAWFSWYDYWQDNYPNY